MFKSFCTILITKIGLVAQRNLLQENNLYLFVYWNNYLLSNQEPWPQDLSCCFTIQDPGCYELTKKSTTAAYITENTSAAVTTLTPKGSSNTYVDMYVNKLKLSSDKMCVIVNMVKVNVNRAHTNQIYVDWFINTEND